MSYGAAIAVVGSALIGGSKSNSASKRAARQAQANREFIQSQIPKTITTDFGFGQFNFENLGDGNFTSSITGSPGHVEPHFISAPDFSDLRGLSDQFGALSEQYNALDGDIKALRGIRRDARDLRPLVAPGFSKLRDARLNAIEDARSATTSNLKESLARRRVSGSSFGNDALSRTQAEFSKQKSQAEAQTILEELDATLQILDFERTVTGQISQTLVAKLTGQQNSLAGQAQIAQFIAGTEFATDQFNAAAAQHADATNIGIDLAMMQAAFGGTQMALDHIARLTSALNGASAVETEATIRRGERQAETVGAVGGALAYGIGTRGNGGTGQNTAGRV